MSHRLAVLLCCAAAATPSAGSPPHILFVVADDFGYNDIGYHQNQPSGANPEGRPTTNDAAGVMLTPNLDRLASQGVKLDSYYVQPMCTPTRSTIMTGRYPLHTGMGPFVIVQGQPYGLPGRETLLPELLRDAGYDTHAIGKWHLGACDERYEPTFRGFNSYTGYLSGVEDYYNHSGDWRNGSRPDVAPSCGADVSDIYSTTLYINEMDRVLTARANKSAPLFMYLAFQNVHNPYEAPPASLVDINATYPNITSEERRVYGGMVSALDIAFGDAVELFKQHGLWEDTLLVFTTDNGGVGPGNNYPLRGKKGNDWEGGIRGTAFVRGTDSSLAKVPAGGVRHQLMHSSDWLPTLVLGVAKGSTAKTLPLDGHNQWDVIQSDVPTERDFILHNIPVHAEPVYRRGPLGIPVLTTTACLGPSVDTSIHACLALGLIGGAVRKGDLKLLVVGNVTFGVQSNTPEHMKQLTPDGFHPEGDSVPLPHNGMFLFNIPADPTETHNLAANNPESLQEMVDFYTKWTLAEGTVPPVYAIRGFLDPDRLNHPDGETCHGPFVGSRYCAYGNEFDCFVRGVALGGSDDVISAAPLATAGDCQKACAAEAGCLFFTHDGVMCTLRRARGEEAACAAGATCTYGPAVCPGSD